MDPLGGLEKVVSLVLYLRKLNKLLATNATKAIELCADVSSTMAILDQIKRRPKDSLGDGLAKKLEQLSDLLERVTKQVEPFRHDKLVKMGPLSSAYKMLKSWGTGQRTQDALDGLTEEHNKLVSKIKMELNVKVATTMDTLVDQNNLIQQTQRENQEQLVALINEERELHKESLQALTKALKARTEDNDSNQREQSKILGPALVLAVMRVRDLETDSNAAEVKAVQDILAHPCLGKYAFSKKISFEDMEEDDRSLASDRDEFGHQDTALVAAVRGGKRAVVELLLSASANLGKGELNPNDVNKRGTTPLLMAIEKSAKERDIWTEIMTILLSHKALDINMCGRYGSGLSPLKLAIVRGIDQRRKDLVRKLLDAKQAGEQLKINEDNVLTFAITLGLDNNSDKSRGRGPKKTPEELALAAKMQCDMITMICAVPSVDVNRVDHVTTMRPLFHAIDLRRLDIVKALHSSTKSHASNSNDLDLGVSMRVVLNHPEDIGRLYPAHTAEHKSSRIEFEDTPALLYAVLHAPAIARNLIGSGNWLCENSAGITPIIACAMQGEAQLLGEILQKSDVRTNKGPINKTCQTHHMTALAHAIKHGHKQCVELLLQQPQIDPNKAPTGLMPNPCPLMLAIELGAIESAIKLIEHKDTDLNTTDRDGWTPLTLAVSKAQKQVVHSLLKAPRTLVSLGTRLGRLSGATPLALCTEPQHAEIKSMLLLEFAKRPSEAAVALYAAIGGIFSPGEP